MEGARANRSEATIEGLVRDIACPMQNLDGDATHLSLKCVRECVKAGSPIGILTKGGEIYLPISDKMPDYSQRQRLMPFVGKYVQVKGISFERHGTHRILFSAGAYAPNGNPNAFIDTSRVTAMRKFGKANRSSFATLRMTGEEEV
jgi:hypothetical protein